MAIKCINLTQVICDDYGESILLVNWQDARKLEWTAPNDGAFQRCPSCSKKYKEEIFRQGKLAQIVNECPLVNDVK